MAQPLIVPLPPDLFLGGSFELRVTALDPATGDVVTGVKVSNVTIEVENFGPLTKTSTAVPPLIRSGA